MLDAKRRYACPTCQREMRAQGDELPAYFPFCSERCKLIDLGKWLNGSYHIPGKHLGKDDGPTGVERDASEQKSS